LLLSWRYENPDAGPGGEPVCLGFAPLTIVPLPFEDCMDLLGPATAYDASSETLVIEAASPYVVQLNTTAYADVGTPIPCFVSNSVEASPGRFEWDTSGCPGATSFEIAILTVEQQDAPPYVLRVDVTVPADGGATSCGLPDEVLFTPLPVGSCEEAMGFARYDETARTFSWAVASGIRPTEISVTTDTLAETTLGEPALEGGAFVWDLAGVIADGATRVVFQMARAVDGCGLPFMSDLSLSYAPGDGGAWTATCSTGGQCHPACAERCGCE
jgi:hypothetical protein